MTSNPFQAELHVKSKNIKLNCHANESKGMTRWWNFLEATQRLCVETIWPYSSDMHIFSEKISVTWKLNSKNQCPLSKELLSEKSKPNWGGMKRISFTLEKSVSISLSWLWNRGI